MIKLPVIGIMVLLGGCVSSHSFRSGAGTTYSPTKASNVLVFYAPEDVKQPYKVIGEINTAGSSGWFKNEGDLTNKARSEAAKLGADAIIVRSFDKGSGGDRAAAVFWAQMTKLRTSPRSNSRSDGNLNPLTAETEAVVDPSIVVLLTT